MASNQTTVRSNVMRGWGVVAIVMCACGNGGGTTSDGGVDGATIDGTGIDAPVDAPPTTDGSRVGVVALGIRVPVVAKLEAGAMRRQVLVSQDGTFYFPGRFASGTSYTLTVNDTRCAIVGATGTTGAVDVTAPLYCHGIVELDALQLPSSLRIVPAFDPGAFTYGGKRPFLMDAAFPITLTPSAAYPGEPSLKVSLINATSDQAITVPYGTGITIDVTHASGVPPAQYTIAPS